jgi:hypothetical protein
LGDVRGAFDHTKHPKQSADKKHRAEDADFGESVGAGMKNLRHEFMLIFYLENLSYAYNWRENNNFEDNKKMALCQVGQFK